MVNEYFQKKANEFKRELKHSKVYPANVVKIEEDSASFQNLKVIPVSKFSLPFVLKAGESIILDFGCHNVGYLNFSAGHDASTKITSSVIKLKFHFGEFPLEITKPASEYKGTLGNGWIQDDIKSFVFTPYTGSLERRYAFRYVKIERVDSGFYPLVITDMYSDSVSAVDIDNCEKISIPDEMLRKIYDISLMTLKECEQDVFEDGPKRDRRLWLGDLRLQALTDYVTFKNPDLIKRCLYLFAAYHKKNGFAASYLYQNSPPYIDDENGWHILEYSMYYVSCLYDYLRANADDIAFVEELFDFAMAQMKGCADRFDEESGNFVPLAPFIEWCPGLDGSCALLGIYIYTLKQLRYICEVLGKETDFADNEINRASKALKALYSEEKGLFVTQKGQVSMHSQIWAVLSGILDNETNVKLLERIEADNMEKTIHTPYMKHFHIEALYECGLKERAMEVIKEYWGKIVEAGFDCCPEVFNVDDDFESPYKAPEVNSACHAWSCTPAYWIYRYYNEQ